MDNKIDVKLNFCVNVPAASNPTPRFNEGGDCFICATSSIFTHLFPEKVPSLEQIASWWEYRDADTNKPNPNKRRGFANTWYGIDEMFHRACYESEYPIEYFKEFIYPEYDFRFHSHEWGHWHTGYVYERRIESLLKSGWVILANINCNGEGPIRNTGYWNSTDHFAVLDGIKLQWEPGLADDDGKIISKALKGYVHVVCSAKGMYWCKTDDLVDKHGLGAFYIVRRSIIQL